MAPIETRTFIPSAKPLAPSITVIETVIPKPVTVIDKVNAPALNIAKISEVQSAAPDTQAANGGSLIPPTTLESPIQSGVPEIIQPITVIDRKHPTSKILSLQDVSEVRLTTDNKGLVSRSDLQESGTIFNRNQPKMKKDETPKGAPWSEEELKQGKEYLERLRQAEAERRAREAAEAAKKKS